MLLVCVLALASVAASTAEELANLRGPNVEEEHHKTKIHSSQEGKVREQEKWLDKYLEKISKQPGDVDIQQNALPGSGKLLGGEQKALDYYYGGAKPGLGYEGFVITRKYSDDKCSGPGTTTFNFSLSHYGVIV
jgi:lipid II:glycine glycyltransferase (peptidoglycan interpeptide bridge formation enzyme)